MYAYTSHNQQLTHTENSTKLDHSLTDNAQPQFLK